MNRFEYGLKNLSYGETSVNRARNIRLYDGDTKTGFEGGEVLLTNHRLLWSSPGETSSCLSLQLKYIIFIEEEVPSAFAFTRSSKVVLHLSPPAPDKPPGPVQSSLNNYIKLSFKDGLDDSFVRDLRNAVTARAWEFLPIVQAQQTRGAPGKIMPPAIKPRTGIVGIERGLQEKQKQTEQTISVAFQDLSKLMDKAKEMVNLSKVISTKIREKQGSITEDETIQFKSYLLSLGIDDPVTRESVSNESKFIEKLGQEIVEILEVPIREQGGMMSLTDAYCRVNRARGLELVSPEDLYRACRTLRTPLKLRVFDSGVIVLQLSEQNDSAVVADTEAAIKLHGSLSALELSQSLGISVLLAKERLLTTENVGKACRDESVEGLRFYPNLFIEREA